MGELNSFPWYPVLRIYKDGGLEALEGHKADLKAYEIELQDRLQKVKQELCELHTIQDNKS